MLSEEEKSGLKRIKRHQFVAEAGGWAIIAFFALLSFFDDTTFYKNNIGKMFLFGFVILFYLIFYRIFVALSTCPRCKENFGWRFSWQNKKCDNCGLSIDELS